MRVTAADDALLSPSHERDTAYIAVHQYRGMEWRPYFEAVEAIMDEYGGRPHWGKRHFQTAATLAERYPRWADFQAARDELDPEPRLHQRVRRARPRALSAGAAFARVDEYRPRLQEGLALAAVGGDDVDDLLALHQVEGVEALAELAGLGVAHVDAVADLQVAGGGPLSGVWTSPAPSSASSSRPAGSQGEGSRAASPLPEAR